MAKRWTKQEEKILVEIVERYWDPYNYWAVANRLKRSYDACVKRYWQIIDGWYCDGDNKTIYEYIDSKEK